MRPGFLELATLCFALLPSSLYATPEAVGLAAATERVSGEGGPAFMEDSEIDPERLRAERRAEAHDIDFFAPYYSIEEGRETALFLMNTVSDPISVTVAAIAGGAELPLGTYVIDSLRHIELSLRERLVGFEETFATGSLRISLLGDAETLQSWAVILQPGGQTFELPLVTPEEITYKRAISFWDTTISAIPGAGGVAYHLLNTSDGPIEVQLMAGDGTRSDTASLALAPGQPTRVDGLGVKPFGPRGWLELHHGGEPGDLVGVGIAGRHRNALPLPLVPLGEAETQERQESMPVSWVDEKAHGGGSVGEIWTTVFNPGAERRPVRVDAFDAETGGYLGHADLEVNPREVLSSSIRRLIPAAAAGSDSIRLRLRSEGGGVLVQGFRALSGGVVVDLAFFPYETHPNGTYPLPDPSRYDTVTTVVNVGYESSKIAAQVYWNGGTYSIGPLEIPPGGVHRFDLRTLAENAPADLLGRELDTERPAGVFKWTLLQGSDRLLGRTEAKPRGQEDRFGFSCYGCCWKFPRAMVVPSLVEFTPGAEVPFQVSEAIDDCSGTMGPYPTGALSLSSPSPFVWDGSTITSSTAADASVTFESEALQVMPTCFSWLKKLLGFGRAEMCEATFNPRGYDSENKTCSQQTGSCIECKACCHNISQQQTCQGKNQDQTTTNRNACLGVCFHDWQGNGC